MPRSKREWAARMLVMIESPYKGDKKKQQILFLYAQRCLKDSLYRGEAPFAGHLLYTQVLNDANQDERAIGIDCHLSWLDPAVKIVAYIDYGISKGMKMAIDLANKREKPISYRRIGRNKDV